ncbi:MAG: hypothetical protein O9342_06875 [Beijerinckiaceae bacterium]|nr:hypothetical protein [Beijerinckiaceae bacterium]
MRRARALALLTLLAAPGMAAEPEKIVRSVLPGETVRVYIAYHAERDCTRSGEIRLAMIEPPAQGRLFLRETTTRPGFGYNNPRHHCNQREIAAVEVAYEASGKAEGLQRTRYGLVFSDGQMRLIDAEITVWAPPAEPKAE